MASVTLIAHLVNQQVAHRILALQILVLLLERPTEDSVEIAIALCRSVGSFLTEVDNKSMTAMFELFRTVLQEGKIHKRIQYMIEVLFEIRKDKFKDFPAIPPDLDLVEEEDQNTHFISLDDDLEVQESSNIFKLDPDYLANEGKYEEIRREILGEENSDDEEDSSNDHSDLESEEEQEGKTFPECQN